VSNTNRLIQRSKDLSSSLKVICTDRVLLSPADRAEEAKRLIEEGHKVKKELKDHDLNQEASDISALVSKTEEWLQGFLQIHSINSESSVA